MRVRPNNWHGKYSKKNAKNIAKMAAFSTPDTFPHLWKDCAFPELIRSIFVR